jgi:hypothetical protein
MRAAATVVGLLSASLAELHLSISHSPVSIGVSAQLRLTRVDGALEPLLALDEWCRRLALVLRIATSISAGRKVRQHTLESSVDALVDSTDHLIRGHSLSRHLSPMAGRELYLGDESGVVNIASFWLAPIEEVVRLLCLVRVRAAPNIPWDVWDAVILEVLAQDPKRGSSSPGCLTAGGLRAPPPRNVVKRFGYDRATRKLRVSLADMESVPQCWEMEAAALGALLTVQDHAAMCRLAAACSSRRRGIVTTVEATAAAA